MFHITTSEFCTYCEKAKNLILEKGFQYKENPLDDPAKLSSFREAGFTKVPQIWYMGNHIGGFDDLKKWFEENSATLQRSQS